jgi:ribonuclease J
VVLHTGDFKMDQLPLDGRITDLRAFARLGEEGVDLFLTDSTNAEVPGFTDAERDICPASTRSSGTRSGGSSWPPSPRTSTASSRSSTRRRRHGRKVAFVGRSMVRNMGIAADLGYLHVPDGVVVDVKKLADLPDDKIVLICTGSQGEPMAALSRMANRDHRSINVGPATPSSSPPP